MRPLLVLLLALAGCAGSAPAPTGLAAVIPGTSWTLERVVTADGGVLRGDGDQVTFGAGGEVILASCNQCTGQFAMDGDALTVAAPLACTRRACPFGTVELEAYLAGTSTLRREGDYLIAEPLTELGEPTGAQVLMVPASVR